MMYWHRPVIVFVVVGTLLVGHTPVIALVIHVAEVGVSLGDEVPGGAGRAIRELGVTLPEVSVIDTRTTLQRMCCVHTSFTRLNFKSLISNVPKCRCEMKEAKRNSSDS